MVDKAQSERLQPSLLDRLTDNKPGELKESRDSRVIDVRRLREIILRDLSWLLNTTNQGALIDFERFPNVRDSVINYGVADIAGGARTNSELTRIQRQLRATIEKFEPRIMPGTLEIKQRDTQGRNAILAFDIRGDLWAQPVPLELYLRTELDTTSGEVRVDH